ncbi:Acyl-CoA synthetase (NDP forming) [Actinomadura meyerae]|uniref:Acyl-CoA synthetase (NDP forming) n=1 Tax=Actinomadura meyerae TaxID=240840 RepID=A0A239NUZ2_9ACTN|nr:acetate--CoA ligase family protein [Actinomadura meyerae]SNT58560.1 Acyl-CoA synthetase (NDP forming) [Actinomadura meyerae]
MSGTVDGAAPAGPAEREAARRRLARPARLRALFAPRSVALVGASESSGWSRLVVASLRAGRLPGRIVPVNPRHASVFGLPAVPGLRALDEPVDLAFCQVATERVDAVMEEAAEAGVRNLVVLASGYGESGAHGHRRERELLDRAIELDLTVLGPNTLGYINPRARAAPFGLPVTSPLRPGGVGVVLQSGALSSAVLDFSSRHGIGLSLLSSMGNETVVTATDVLAHLLEDDRTRAIAMFLETIRDAGGFVDLARRALSAGKPVVVLKVGRSDAGRASALAHTGAVAGDDAVTDAVFRRSGVVRVRSLEELLVTADLLAQGLPLAEPRMGVVSASGGACDIIADRACDEGIEVPELASGTCDRLTELLPPFAVARNPLDVTGFVLARPPSGGRGLADLCLEAMVDDPSVDFVFNSLSLPSREPPDPEPLDRRLAALAETARSAAKPVVHYSTTCTDLAPYAREALDRHGLQVLPGIELGMTAVGHALRWSRARRRLLRHAPGPAEDSPAAVPAPRPPARTGPWSEAAARDLLAAHGAPLVPAALVRTREEAQAAADALGCPVALKVCSAGIAHKSDIGGVALAVTGPREVGAAFDRVHAAGRAHTGDVEGVLVTPMRRGGIELFAGVTVDPVFGPVLAVGLGGVFVEVLDDVSLRALPVDPGEVEEMLGELRGAAILRGVRGGTPADVGAVARAVSALTRAAASLGPSLRALEVNPWWVHGSQVEALDVLVVTASPEDGDPRP